MTDNPAELLRHAAAALRDAAEQATHEQGPRWVLGETKGSRSKVVLDHPDSPTVLIETWAARLERVNTYLTLVGPATGTALAEWLDYAARRHDALVTAAHQVWADDTAGRDKHITDTTDQRALAVARAVLGEVAE